MQAINTIVKRSQYITKLSKLEFNTAIDSIFIIKSLLIAILKDCGSISGDNKAAISKLMHEILYLENKDTISDVDFFYIDTHFYLILTNIKGFHRVANIIVKEKSQVDRVLRLFMSGTESYMSIIRIYSQILCGVQSDNTQKSLSALGELYDLIKECMASAKSRHPEFF